MKEVYFDKTPELMQAVADYDLKMRKLEGMGAIRKWWKTPEVLGMSRRHWIRASIIVWLLSKGIISIKTANKLNKKIT